MNDQAETDPGTVQLPPLPLPWAQALRALALGAQRTPPGILYWEFGIDGPAELYTALEEVCKHLSDELTARGVRAW